MELLEWRGLLDCGDNSCLFKARGGGQRTNGGCRCIPIQIPNRTPLRLTISMLIENERRLREENANLRSEITELRARVVGGQAVDVDRSA